jgi:hypothetical protein
MTSVPVTKKLQANSTADPKLKSVGFAFADNPEYKADSKKKNKDHKRGSQPEGSQNVVGVQPKRIASKESMKKSMQKTSKAMTDEQTTIASIASCSLFKENSDSFDPCLVAAISNHVKPSEEYEGAYVVETQFYMDWSVQNRSELVAADEPLEWEMNRDTYNLAGVIAHIRASSSKKKTEDIQSEVITKSVEGYKAIPIMLKVTECRNETDYNAHVSVDGFPILIGTRHFGPGILIPAHSDRSVSCEYRSLVDAKRYKDYVESKKTLENINVSLIEKSPDKYELKTGTDVAKRFAKESHKYLGASSHDTVKEQLVTASKPSVFISASAAQAFKEKLTKEASAVQCFDGIKSYLKFSSPEQHHARHFSQESIMSVDSHCIVSLAGTIVYIVDMQQ